MPPGPTAQSPWYFSLSCSQQAYAWQHFSPRASRQPEPGGCHSAPAPRRPGFGFERKPCRRSAGQDSSDRKDSTDFHCGVPMLAFGEASSAVAREKTRPGDALRASSCISRDVAFGSEATLAGAECAQLIYLKVPSPS
jgi:hypothetical protein